MLKNKILQNHLVCACVANLKIDAIYVLYLDSFCDKNLAIQKVFAFSDSAKLVVKANDGGWLYTGLHGPSRENVDGRNEKSFDIYIIDSSFSSSPF